MSIDFSNLLKMLRIASKGPALKQQGMDERTGEEGTRIQHRIMLTFSKKMDFLIPYPFPTYTLVFSGRAW